MIIDDSKMIRQIAEKFLKEQGYEIILVEDGFDSLAKIAEKIPDIIFIDVMMPRLDGYSTCQIIRSNNNYKKLPIIFLSSKDSPFDEARGLMVGGTSYMAKPFTKDSILAIINEYTN